MQLWETFLVVIGGNTVLLAVFAWLAKSLTMHHFSKDLEVFKSNLKVDADAEMERIKHELSLGTIEHQVKFAKLYERRGEVIGKIYSLLVKTDRAVQMFRTTLSHEIVKTSEEDKKKIVQRVQEASSELYKYFDENRIYLPDCVCPALEKLSKNVYSQAARPIIPSQPLFSIAEGLSWEEQVQKGEDWKQKHKNEHEEYWEFFQLEVPRLRRILEQELKALMGVSE